MGFYFVCSKYCNQCNVNVHVHEYVGHIHANVHVYVSLMGHFTSCYFGIHVSVAWGPARSDNLIIVAVMQVQQWYMYMYFIVM